MSKGRIELPGNPLPKKKKKPGQSGKKKKDIGGGFLRKAFGDDSGVVGAVDVDPVSGDFTTAENYTSQIVTDPDDPPNRAQPPHRPKLRARDM